jgi:hypothetical protein
VHASKTGVTAEDTMRRSYGLNRLGRSGFAAGWGGGLAWVC